MIEFDGSSVQSKVIMIVGDGMADRPVKELDGRTPLEAARTPNMDYIAKIGISGLMDPVAPGIAVGSDVAFLAIFGYDPHEFYTGRGAFEAAGAGIDVKLGDVAFRCNFATADEKMTILDTRAGGISKGVHELADALNEITIESVPGVQLTFRATLGFRSVVAFRGGGLSTKVTLPDYISVKSLRNTINPLDKSRDALNTARVLNEFVAKSYEVLNKHPVNANRVANGKPPANIILPWAAGVVPKMRSFQESYGLRGACVAAVSIVRGFSHFAGMDFFKVPGATGHIDTDTLAKGRVALRALRDHDFVLLHVEGPDEASHENDVKGKITIIEKIDRMVGEILKEFDLEKNYVVILSDHTTPLGFKKHTGDPTPIAIAGSGVRSDEVDSFGERSVANGGLLRIRGLDVMPILLDLMNKSRFFGS